LNWVNKFADNGQEYQEDEVGNIFQYHGGVKPKACQNCKDPFESKLELVEKKGTVPMYVCKNCDFKNASGDAALDHKITTDHNILKKTSERVIAIEKKIIGSVAHITQEDNDVIILCSECNANRIL
jgi:protein-arginine kinase activator protein McsA